MMEPFLHYPTALDWIEHGLAFVGAGAVGWWLHGWFCDRVEDEVEDEVWP